MVIATHFYPLIMYLILLFYHFSVPISHSLFSLELPYFELRTLNSELLLQRLCLRSAVDGGNVGFGKLLFSDVKFLMHQRFYLVDQGHCIHLVFL